MNKVKEFIKMSQRHFRQSGLQRRRSSEGPVPMFPGPRVICCCVSLSSISVLLHDWPPVFYDCFSLSLLCDLLAHQHSGQGNSENDLKEYFECIICSI